MSMNVDDDGRRIMAIDANKSEPFEIGAQILALLAYPQPEEDDRRIRVEGALCSEVVALACAEQSPNAEALRKRFPHYAKRRQRAGLASLPKRHKKAMQAGTMALGFLQEGISGRPANLPATMSSMSLQNLSKHIANGDGITDDSHYENYDDAIKMVARRIWRPWHPVLHLASAYQIACRMFSGDADGMEYSIYNLAMHKALVDFAQFHASIIRCDPRLTDIAKHLIRIDWQGDVQISAPSGDA